MTGKPNRREVLALGAGLSLAGISLADPPRTDGLPNNVRDVKKLANVQDPAKIEDFPKEPNDNFWVLDFRFKDPRLITAEVPARGKKVCWYLWYQVINKTNKPRTFFPIFELVTTDKQTRHRDQFLPTVQDAIVQLEDPRNYYKIKNSWSISNDPIPPSKETDAVLKAVTGVAVWDDVDPDANYYSIFVTGLSNGYRRTDPIPPDDKEVIRRKTLQLNFKRIGDRFEMKSSEIQFQPPAMWVYRGSTLAIPGLPIKNPVPPPPKNPMGGD